MSTLEPTADRVVLSRELSEFLVELSVALHKHAMYPSGHPSLEPAAAAVVRRAEHLLVDRPVIAFGVARRQLIIEGNTTDPHQPVLRRLAEGLHRHHLGAISVTRGIDVGEIHAALRALASDAQQEGPLGLRPHLFQEWSHFRLHPLTFDRLSLAGDVPLASSGSGGGGGRAGHARGAELWVGLARAALVSGETSTVDEELVDDPATVAHAIDEHARAEAYDQVIVGHLLQIAGELKSTPASDSEALRKRTSMLIAALKPDTLRRLVEMGGNAAQRNEFVLDATHGMDVAAVLQIVKATADASGQVISTGLVRLMSKLASNAGTGTDEARPVADSALREQVTQLLSGWNLEDPNPERYSRVLQHLANHDVVECETKSEGGPEPRDPVRIVQMALEVKAMGPLVTRAIERLAADGKVGSILDLLKSRPRDSDAVADAIVAQLVQPPNLLALVTREPIDEASLDGLLPFMSAEGFQALLDVLASSENRATRRKLIDRLARAALDTGPYIAARLEDERWYVLRNMLLLMERSGQIPEGFSATRWTAHQDARVRYEALRLQLTIPRERDRAIRTALDDEDSRLVRLGLTALQQDCPAAYAPQVAALAVSPTSDPEARLLAVTALAKLREPDALGALLHVLDGGKTFFRRQKLAPKTPVVVVALRGLAQVWPEEPRAQVFLKLARTSADPDLRQAAQADSP